MDIGFTHPGGLESALQGAEVIFNLGMDEFELPKDCFVIYQGSHGDRGAHRADLIFPGACYTEESGIYVNTEGRSQLALRANFAPGDAKENWAIIRALSGKLDCTLGFNSLLELRSRLTNDFPHIARLNETIKSKWNNSDFTGFSTDLPFKTYYKDFYKTNPIARASVVLNDLSKNQNADHQIRAAE
jgi:NADH-quinone oxidoreductase subunit G